MNKIPQKTLRISLYILSALLVLGLAVFLIFKFRPSASENDTPNISFSIKNPVVNITGGGGQLIYLWTLPVAPYINENPTLQTSITKVPSNAPPYNDTNAWYITTVNLDDIFDPTSSISDELTHDIPPNTTPGIYWACGKVFGLGTGTPAPQCYQFEVSVSATAPTQDNVGTLSVMPNLKRVKKGEPVEFTVNYRNYEQDTGLTYKLEFQVTSEAIVENSDLSSIPSSQWETKNCTYDTILNNGEEQTCTWQTGGSTVLGSHAIRVRVFQANSTTPYAKSFTTVEVSNDASVPTDETVPTASTEGLTGDELAGGLGSTGNDPIIVTRDQQTGKITAITFDNNTLLGRITKFASETVGALMVIAIIIGGILYITAGGDPAKAEKGKKTVLYAVIGIMVMILSYGILVFVITELNKIFP